MCAKLHHLCALNGDALSRRCVPRTGHLDKKDQRPTPIAASLDATVHPASARATDAVHTNAVLLVFLQSSSNCL